MHCEGSTSQSCNREDGEKLHGGGFLLVGGLEGVQLKMSRSGLVKFSLIACESVG